MVEMEESVNMYINRCRTYINFMLSTQQWSGIVKSDVDRWLDNFKELELDDKMLVYKLLTNFIYFSEKDVIDALNEGIHNSLFYNIILDKQKKNKFELSSKALSNIVIEELRKTCFIPLLDNNSPHESANYIARLLVQQGIVSHTQSMFLTEIIEGIYDYDYERIVIVDDCVGSGDQLRTYWNNNALVKVNEKEILLKDYCKKNNIDVIYLTLFGYENSIIKLKNELKDLQVCCVRTLGDEQRVFGENSYVWKDKSEMEKAHMLFKELTEQAGIQLYGYKNLDFAFAMHQTIPDWSLPLFWKARPNWNLLLRRKNSND